MIDYGERRAATRDRLAERDLELGVFGAGPNLQYLTGSGVDWRRCPDLEAAGTALFVPAVGEPVLLAGPFAGVDDDLSIEVRRLDHFADPGRAVAAILDDLSASPMRVGVGSYADASVLVGVDSGASRVDLVSIDGILDDLRAIKSPEEVERLRAVADLTEEVMAEVIDGLQAGETMREVGLRIETLGRERGASHVSFPSSAIFNRGGGTDTGDLSNYGADEGLEPGSSVAFDVGFVRDGYCSDWGRSVYFGDPPGEVAAAYEALQTAVVEAIDAIGDEIRRVDEVYPFVEAVCDREGFGEYFRNRHADEPVMGHGIGVEVHEPPWLRPGVDATFREGMVFAIEPKLLKPGEFYLRVEDVVHVTGDGAESLTTFDRDRFVV